MCWNRIIEAEEPVKKTQAQPKVEPRTMSSKGPTKDVSATPQPAPECETVPNLIQAS